MKRCSRALRVEKELPKQLPFRKVRKQAGLVDQETSRNVRPWTHQHILEAVIIHTGNWCCVSDTEAA